MHLASIDGQYFLAGIIEDELVCVFSRLEVDVFTWYEVEAVEMHTDLAQLAMEIMQAIPQAFSNITTARKYFDITLREVDWFVRSWNDQLWTSAEESDDLRAATSMIASPGAIPSITQLEQMTSLQQGLLQWLTAFQPLLLESAIANGSDFLVTKALSLRHICSSIALNCCFGPELSYDSYIPQFQEAVLLAGTLSAVTFSKAKPTFVVWSLLVKSLYFVALKCRHSVLRSEAITSLQSLSRREGLCKCV